MIGNELLKTRVALTWIFLLSALLAVFSYGVPVVSEISAPSGALRDSTVVSWPYVPAYIAGLGRFAAPILGAAIGIAVALNEVRSGTAYSAAVISQGWPRLALVKFLTSALIAIMCIGTMFVAAYLMCLVGLAALPNGTGATPASGPSLSRALTANLIVYIGFLLWAGIGWLVSSLTISTTYSYIIVAAWIFAEQFSYYPYLPGSIHAGATEGWVDYLPDAYTVLWPPVGVAPLPVWLLFAATILVYAVALPLWISRYQRLPLGSVS